MPTKTVPCPKCGRKLNASGEIELAGGKSLVFQCDECLVLVDLFGEKTEAALTFCLDSKDRPVDPATGEIIRFD